MPFDLLSLPLNARFKILKASDLQTLLQLRKASFHSLWLDHILQNQVCKSTRDIVDLSVLRARETTVYNFDCFVRETTVYNFDCFVGKLYGCKFGIEILEFRSFPYRDCALFCMSIPISKLRPYLCFAESLFSVIRTVA